MDVLIVVLVAFVAGYVIGAYDIDRTCESPDCDNCPFPPCDKSKRP